MPMHPVALLMNSVNSLIASLSDAIIEVYHAAMHNYCDAYDCAPDSYVMIVATSLNDLPSIL